jgi:hypothetical protein
LNASLMGRTVIASSLVAMTHMGSALTSR